jgi:hypothetical protein
MSGLSMMRHDAKFTKALQSVGRPRGDGAVIGSDERCQAQNARGRWFLKTNAI